MEKVLRDYQQEMLDRLYDTWAQHRSIMVQMPTGTGKTHLMAAVIKREKGKANGERLATPFPSVLIVAHRYELLEQIKQALAAFGLAGEHVRIESVQKLSKHIDDTDFTPSLVVVDEAHHALAKTYRALWDKWPYAKFLGLTATPCRLNGTAFTDLFDTLLQSWTIQEFINNGWLSDFEYVSASPDSKAMQLVDSLKKRGVDGDYQTKEMAAVMDVPESIEHLYKTYRQFANGKKGIVYAINREHAKHIAAYYQEQGVSCSMIDAKTPTENRRQIVADYKEGLLRVLVNVDIFSEGFDCPEVEFIQLARPTLSLSKYLQQVGRGMRISEGKDAVMILDMVGLYQSFGLPTEERDWLLTFMGKLAGKGHHGIARPVVIKEDRAAEKELVNLQMVRIRSKKESLEGLNIYLLEGKYGVMKDGKMTTEPVFEHIRRCDNSLFYALATYPYPIYKSRTTVIDLQGLDQQVQLFGNVELKGDFLYGKDIKGCLMVWDTVGKRYYKDHEPQFEKIGGLDTVKSVKGKYELRYARGMQSFLFDKEEVLFNSYIAIIRDILILKCDGFRIYKIFGYEDNHVLIRTKKEEGSLQVSWNGHFGRYYDSIPERFTLYPSFSDLQLDRVK